MNNDSSKLGLSRAQIVMQNDGTTAVMLDETSMHYIKRTELAVVFREEEDLYLRCSHSFYVAIEASVDLCLKLIKGESTTVLARCGAVLVSMLNVPILKASMPLPLGRGDTLQKRLLTRLSSLMASVGTVMQAHNMRLVGSYVGPSFSMTVYEHWGYLVCIVYLMLKGDCAAFENSRKPWLGKWYSTNADVVSPCGIAKCAKKYFSRVVGASVDAVVVMDPNVRIVNKTTSTNRLRIGGVECLSISRGDHTGSFDKHMKNVTDSLQEATPSISSLEAQVLVNEFVDNITQEISKI